MQSPKPPATRPPASGQWPGSRPWPEARLLGPGPGRVSARGSFAGHLVDVYTPVREEEAS